MLHDKEINAFKEKLFETEKILVHRSFDQFELRGILNRTELTRFAISRIHQNMNTLSGKIQLRAVKGKSILTTETSDLSNEGIIRMISNAEESISYIPEIPYFQGLPQKPDSYPSLPSEAKLLNTEERAAIVGQAIDQAETVSKEISIAGTCYTSDGFITVLSSEGIEASHNLRFNNFKIDALSGPFDGRGFGGEVFNWKTEEPDFLEMASKAAKIAVLSEKATKIEPGEYTVVLSPSASATIASFLAMFSNGLRVYENRSFLSDRIGETVFDERFSLQDLPLSPHKSLLNLPFDGEGNPKENVSLIEKGVFKSAILDSLTASRFYDDLTKTTSHCGLSFTQYDSAFPTAYSIVLEPGDGGSTEELISSTKKGLFINTFFYSNIAHASSGSITGLTRNGFFTIEDGELKDPVTNMRFTDSIPRMLNSIDTIGSDLKLFTRTSSPSLKLEKFKFTGVAHST